MNKNNDNHSGSERVTIVLERYAAALYEGTAPDVLDYLAMVPEHERRELAAWMDWTFDRLPADVLAANNAAAWEEMSEAERLAVRFRIVRGQRGRVNC